LFYKPESYLLPGQDSPSARGYNHSELGTFKADKDPVRGAHGDPF